MLPSLEIGVVRDTLECPENRCGTSCNAREINLIKKEIFKMLSSWLFRYVTDPDKYKLKLCLSLPQVQRVYKLEIALISY